MSYCQVQQLGRKTNENLIQFWQHSFLPDKNDYYYDDENDAYRTNYSFLRALPNHCNF